MAISFLTIFRTVDLERSAIAELAVNASATLAITIKTLLFIHHVTLVEAPEPPGARGGHGAATYAFPAAGVIGAPAALRAFRIVVEPARAHHADVPATALLTVVIDASNTACSVPLTAGIVLPVLAVIPLPLLAVIPLPLLAVIPLPLLAVIPLPLLAVIPLPLLTVIPLALRAIIVLTSLD